LLLLVQVHLFRPWSAQHLLAALPPTARRIAVLDRTKEPGSVGEPLYLDVVATIAQDIAGEAAVRLPCGCDTCLADIQSSL
jgi:pyruvate-ferredoxin/flavodoxin oxidoreductase